MTRSEKIELAHELASKSSKTVWEVFMADYRFTTETFGCGANDVADIVLNAVLDKLSSGIDGQ